MNKKIIYSLSDPITNQVKYIGKTNNIKKRLNRHLSNHSLIHSTKKNNWVKSLLKKDLIPLIEIVDIVNSDEIDFYEIFYISLFKSWGFTLLNGTNGGDGYDWTGRKHKEISKLKGKINNPNRKSVGQYDLNDNLINTYHSINEASQSINGSKSSISRACRTILKTAYGFKWKFIDEVKNIDLIEPKPNIIKYKKPRLDKRMKKIKVFNLDGTLIDICRSINYTSIKYNCHPLLIKKCCDDKKYYQTKNLTFRYECDFFDYIPHKNYRTSKKYNIGIYSEDNELIKEFKSLKECVSYTKIGKQYISKICKENGVSGLKKLKGYIFRFI